MTTKPFTPTVSIDALRLLLDDCDRFEIVQRTPEQIVLEVYISNYPHRVFVPVWKWEQVQK